VNSLIPRPILLFVVLPVAAAWIFGASLWPLLAAYAAWVAIMLWGARQAGRGTRAKKGDPASVAFLLFLFFGLPVGLASVVAERWTTIAAAYAIWFGLLGLWMLQGLTSRRMSGGEAFGWPFLAGMFLTMAAVPVLTLILRLAQLA